MGCCQSTTASAARAIARVSPRGMRSSAAPPAAPTRARPEPEVEALVQRAASPPQVPVEWMEAASPIQAPVADATMQSPAPPAVSPNLLEDSAAKRGQKSPAQRPLADAPVEAAVLLEVTSHERALAELKRIYDGADANEQGHASKLAITRSLESDEDSLVGLLKEAALNEVHDLVNWVTGHDGEFVSWCEFLSYAEQAAVKGVVHEVKAVEDTIVSRLSASEKLLQRLKELFESSAMDECGCVDKAELSAKLQTQPEEVDGENVGKLVEKAGFNPVWHTFTQLTTGRAGRISWEELKAHVQCGSLQAAEEPDAVLQEDVVLEDAVATELCWGCPACC